MTAARSSILAGALRILVVLIFDQIVAWRVSSSIELLLVAQLLLFARMHLMMSSRGGDAGSAWHLLRVALPPARAQS